MKAFIIALFALAVIRTGAFCVWNLRRKNRVGACGAAILALLCASAAVVIFVIK